MRRRLALGAALLCLLSGCAAPAPASDMEAEYGLWFVVGPEAAELSSSAVAREARGWEEEPTAQELLIALFKGPEDENMHSPFPRGAAVRSVVSEEDGLLQVDLTEQYGGLTGVDLTLADCCITLTLCQLSDVSAVRITVEGETIPYRSRQVLSAADVLLAGIAEKPEEFFSVLYYPRRDGLGLAAEYRGVERQSGTGAAAVLAEELLRGPAPGSEGAPLPEGTQVRTVTVAGGICRLDLSAEFVDHAPQSEGQAALVLYALVNTLCSLQDVERVQLLVEGEALSAYGGIPLDAPLEADPELIRAE